MLISIIGGDMRQLYLAKSLIDSGYDVTLYGFDNCDYIIREAMYAKSIKHATDNSYVIVLPLPFSENSRTIFAPLSSTEILLSSLLSVIKPNTLVLGGKLNDEIINVVEELDAKAVDYLAREEFAVLNTIATCEGAIQIAMENTNYTIHDSKTLVLGYGRIGKLLTNYLLALHSNVSVGARKHSDLAWIFANGAAALETNDALGRLNDFDIVFNTIPKVVIGEKQLAKLNKNVLIIDLASRPGGVDFEYADKAGIKTIWALSLPGKVAAKTSGEIIKKTILNIICEEAT